MFQSNYNLNLFFVFKKRITSNLKRLKYIQKKNLVLTNHLTQLECSLYQDSPRFVSSHSFHNSLLTLKYFFKGFSADSSLTMICVTNTSIFALVKYFSWKFGCCYTLGWYRGLYSNVKFIYSSIHKRGLSHLFYVSKETSFFFLLDSLDYWSVQAQREMGTKENFVFSLNTSFDNFNVDFYFFTSKFTYQIYYYLNILFTYFSANLNQHSLLLQKKILSIPTKTALQRNNWRKKKTIQTTRSSLRKIWSTKKFWPTWKIHKKIQGIQFCRPTTGIRVYKLSKLKNKKFTYSLRVAYQKILSATWKKIWRKKKTDSEPTNKKCQKKNKKYRFWAAKKKNLSS